VRLGKSSVARFRTGGGSLAGSVGIHILLVAAAWSVTVMAPATDRQADQGGGGDASDFEMNVMAAAPSQPEAAANPAVNAFRPTALPVPEAMAKLESLRAVADLSLVPSRPMVQSSGEPSPDSGKQAQNQTPARRAGVAPGSGRRGVGHGHLAGASAKVSPPKLLLAPPPRYPSQAKAAKISGRVGVLIRVQADGSPASAAIYRSCGNRLLDQAAVESAKSWKFSATPALAGGTTIPVVVNVTFAL